MIFNVLFLLLAQLLIPTSRNIAPETPADGLEAKLGTRINNYSLNADNFLDALAKVASQYQIPIAVEWSEDTNTKQKVSQSWIDTDIRELIQQLVSEQPGYEFGIKNEVVHVFPKWTKSSRQNFLDLKIQKFSVDNQVPESASHQLGDLVRLKVSPAIKTGAPLRGIGWSQATSPDDFEISLELENISVRDALDQIALASNRKIWVVTFTDDSLLTPTGFRRTRTLWIDTVSDSEQPVWDSLRWGDAIPSSK